MHRNVTTVRQLFRRVILSLAILGVIWRRALWRQAAIQRDVGLVHFTVGNISCLIEVV